MKLFLLCITIILLFFYVESERIDAQKLLNDVQNAIQNKNRSALENLMTSDLAVNIYRKLDAFLIDEIPVHKILGVEKVDIGVSGNITFLGKVGHSTVHFEAVYSLEKKACLLTGDVKRIEMMIDKVELEKQIRQEGEYDAMMLLLDFREAIRVKNIADFRFFALSSDATFVSCDDDSQTKDSRTMFSHLERIPMKFIPVHQNVEITHLNRTGGWMTFNATIGDRQNITYTAKYQPEFARWFLSQESCSEFYPAFVNTVEMGEPIARYIIKQLQTSIRLRNPRTIEKLVSGTLTESQCNKDVEFKAVEYLHHCIKFEWHLQIWDNFTITDVVFYNYHGLLMFDAQINSKAKNGYAILRDEHGEYRISTITHRKCLYFGSPNLELLEKLEPYIKWMGVADDLLTRYVFCRRYFVPDERRNLFTSPYRLSNNQTVDYKLLKTPYYDNPYYPDLYVVDVKYDNWNGLQSFRAKQQNSTFGLEFEVKGALSIENRQLAAEKIIEFDFLE